MVSVHCSPNDQMLWALDSRWNVHVRAGITEEMPVGTDWEHVPGGNSSCPLPRAPALSSGAASTAGPAFALGVSFPFCCPTEAGDSKDLTEHPLWEGVALFPCSVVWADCFQTSWALVCPGLGLLAALLALPGGWGTLSLDRHSEPHSAGHCPHRAPWSAGPSGGREQTHGRGRSGLS